MEHQEMVKLRRILVAVFDEEDLKTLCFDLNVDYENLPASNKAGKAREIVSTFSRNGRIQELFDTCRILRPHAFDTAGINARTSPTSSSPANPSQIYVNPSDSSNLVVRRGTILTTAAGERMVIDSDFYGGANATLYRATSQKYGNVIVKVFWRGLMPHSAAWNLFNQELRAAEMLQHTNIVRTFDRGLHAGYPFTVMEFLPGGTLRDWMRIHERMRGEDILAIAKQIATAIDFAHAYNIVHRDIKPGNILFAGAAQDRVALGDFGIAKILGAVERDITAPSGSDISGSPGYLAPEAITGAEIGKPADIYGFGVVVYEMICGHIPFDETQTTYALFYAKTQQDAPDIRQFRPDVPETIARRLAQTLSRDIAQRPTTAANLLKGIAAQIGKLQ